MNNEARRKAFEEEWDKNAPLERWGFMKPNFWLFFQAACNLKPPVLTVEQLHKIIHDICTENPQISWAAVENQLAQAIFNAQEAKS